MVLVNINGEDYSIKRRLTEFWDKNTLEKMKKRNSDRVFIVDGRERSGKSTFTIQQMGYLDPEAFKDIPTFLSRVCIDAEELNDTVRKIKNGVVIFDEGFRGFSSRSALSKTNKLLVQTLMEMGQNNNILFIVLPSFFLLDMYPALLRSNSLFHIEENTKTRLRMFKGYNNADKNFMYRQGARKSWKYKRTMFDGIFTGKFPGGKKYEEAYLKKKEQAFANMSLGYKEKEKFNPMADLGLYTIKLKYKELGSIDKVKKYMEDIGFKRSRGWYGEILDIQHNKHLKTPLKDP